LHPTAAKMLVPGQHRHPKDIGTYPIPKSSETLKL